MKLKLFVLAVLLLLVTSSNASVTLTVPYSVSAPASVTSTYTAPQITCMGYGWVFGNPNTMYVTYNFGTVTKTGSQDNSFTVAPNFPVLVNTLNMSTGVWVLTSNGAQIATGTLTAPQLTSALAAFTGAQTTLRNFADQFIMGVVGGTQPDMW